MKLPDLRDKWQWLVTYTVRAWDWITLTILPVMTALNFASFGMNFIHAYLGNRPMNWFSAAFSLGVTFWMARSTKKEAKK